MIIEPKHPQIEMEEALEEPAPAGKQPVPRYSPEALKRFVVDALDNKLFLLQQLPETQPNLINLVFLSLALGGLGDIDPHDVGTIYEYVDKASPRSVNGYPMFLSCRLMGKADWVKAREIIALETDRRRYVLEHLHFDDQET